MFLPVVLMKSGLVIRGLSVLRRAGGYLYKNGVRMPGDENTHHDAEGRRVCNACGLVVFNNEQEAEAFILATGADLPANQGRLSWYYESECRYYHVTTEQRPRAGLNALRRFLP